MNLRYMTHAQTIQALGALAHETRLDVFRLLIRQGADGMAAGDISARLGVKQNTMSANLAVLARAELVEATREGRMIVYRVRIERVRALLSFLMEDCCGGNPALCQPILDEIVC